MFDRVANALGKPIVMESRAGANGAIAAGITARAAPDGYTLMLGLSGTLTSNPSTQLGIAYDPVRDFTPISTLIDLPLFLVVTRRCPPETLRELVDAMRREPGRYNYGSWGPGSVNFLTFEQFKILTGTRPCTSRTRAGRRSSGPSWRAKSRWRSWICPRCVRISTPARSGCSGSPPRRATPRFRTCRRWPSRASRSPPAGYLILVAPAGLPEPIAKRLNAEVVRVLAEPDVRRRLLEAGNVAVGGTRDEAANRIATDIAKWKRIVRDIGYQPQ